MRGASRRGNHGSGPNDAVLERTVPFQTGERRHIVLNRLRRWLRRLERRWIADGSERDRHEALVRERLPGKPIPAEPAADEPGTS